MEQLDKLPPLAIVVFGVTLAIIFAVRYFGLWSGRNAAPENSPVAAQVAAVIVDPTALNRATAAVEAHAVVTKESAAATREAAAIMREGVETIADLVKTLTHMGTEIDRVREEMRITREISRRG